MLKGNCLPSKHVILSEIAVLCSLACKKPYSEDFTVLRTLSPELFNFKDFKHGFVEFPLPHLAADSWVCAINRRHLRLRGETVVRVRERLKTEIKLFLVNIYFAF